MNRQILRLAVPNIVTNITIPLLGLVDTAIMGHLPSPVFLGAIALGSMVFNFVFWGFGFLRMGTTGLTAQAFGRKDQHLQYLMLSRGILLALLLALVLIIFSGPIAWLGFHFVDGNMETIGLAQQYFRIRIIAAPATLMQLVLFGWFLGMQNSFWPMMVALATNVLNIAFDIMFVFGFGLASAGVAWGTVLAQYSGLMMGMYITWRQYGFLFRKIKWETLFNRPQLIAYFQININLFIRTILLLFAFYFFTIQSAAFGDLILAANSVLLQLIALVSYGIDGFAFAVESLVGKYKGASDLKMLKKSIRYIFAWGMGLALMYAIFYWLSAKEIIKILTNQQAVRNVAYQYIWWLIPAPIINSLAYLWDGIYIGATAGKSMRNIMLISVLLIYLPLYYFTRDYWTVNGLWFSFTVFMLSRALLMSLFSKKAVLNSL